MVEADEEVVNGDDVLLMAQLALAVVENAVGDFLATLPALAADPVRLVSPRAHALQLTSALSSTS